MTRIVKVPDEFAEVFEQAEQTVASYFAKKREVPSRGHIEIADNRYVLVRAPALSVEFYDMMIDLYQGEEERALAVGKNLLFHLAHSIGASDARAFHAQLGLEEPVAKLSAGPAHFAHTGWASVHILPESNPVPNEDYFLVYDHPYSFESDSWYRAGRVAPNPMCFMNAGYSSGWCEESFGVPLVAAEILCVAQGDPRCRFVMGHPYRIEQLITDYLDTHPDVAEQVKEYSIPGEFQHRQLEERLQLSENRYHQLFESATDGIFLLSEGRIEHANRHAAELLERPRADLQGRSFTELSPPVQADGTPSSTMMQGYMERALIGDPLLFLWRFDRGGRDDSVEVELSLSRVEDTSGDLLAIVRDLSERERLEREVRQLQKMEAVGRLAGGVAHDFNNLLTGVFGNLAMAQNQVSPDGPLAERLTEIEGIAQRAANLTRQLLAFSRKQVIDPRALDLNELIEGMHKMLSRIIGEDINPRTSPGANPATIKADPGQIEQIVVNLAINARDAMTAGGELSISTVNVLLDEAYCAAHPDAQPGEHVRLSIRDTGIGMDEQTRRQIFEPFFTTKGEHEGTGLGLSTVYGIVKQHGGSIEVRSEVGKGTTFDVYFRSSTAPTDTLDDASLDEELPTGSERILVVEDEPSVRSITVEILRRAGFTVMHAPGGEEALAIAAGQGRTIDLLITDVVMPRMNGRELSRELVARHPDIKVLFTSGYSHDVLSRQGVLEPGVTLLAKPYTPQTLTAAIRKMLDE